MLSLFVKQQPRGNEYQENKICTYKRFDNGWRRSNYEFGIMNETHGDCPSLRIIYLCPHKVDNNANSLCEIVIQTYK